VTEPTPIRSELNTPPQPDREPEPEAPARRQPGTMIEVHVEGEEPYEVHVTNRERLHYEKTAARHREWPSAADGQSFAMTFVTWSAARRAERTALSFEQWQEALIDWFTVEDRPADPTR
jgi:hypothetical protein